MLAAPRKRAGADADALRAAYFRRYVDAWKTFLVSLSVKEPTSIDEVRSLLKAFVMDRPLDAIWRNASKDLIFKDESLIGKLTGKAKAGIGGKIKKMFGKDGEGDGEGGDGDQAAPQGRGGKRTSDDPMTPEDVGKEFGPFLSFGMTKPTGLETYGQILAELQGAVGESGAPDPARVPGHGEDAAGEAAEPDQQLQRERLGGRAAREDPDAAAARRGGRGQRRDRRFGEPQVVRQHRGGLRPAAVRQVPVHPLARARATRTSTMCRSSSSPRPARCGSTSRSRCRRTSITRPGRRCSMCATARA